MSIHELSDAENSLSPCLRELAQRQASERIPGDLFTAVQRFFDQIAHFFMNCFHQNYRVFYQNLIRKPSLPPHKYLEFDCNWCEILIWDPNCSGKVDKLWDMYANLPDTDRPHMEKIKDRPYREEIENGVRFYHSFRDIERLPGLSGYITANRTYCCFEAFAYGGKASESQNGFICKTNHNLFEGYKIQQSLFEKAREYICSKDFSPVKFIFDETKDDAESISAIPASDFSPEGMEKSFADFWSQIDLPEPETFALDGQFSESPEDVISTGSPAGIAESIFTQVYKEFDGLCIGEQHEHLAPKQLIIEHMQCLKVLGVKTLFLEHLFYDTVQKDLDSYFDSQSDEMPMMLRMSLSRMDNTLLSPPLGSKYPKKMRERFSFTQLVRIAKRAGIRVVGIDTTLSYECGVLSPGTAPKFSERVTAMNYVASQIIGHEKQEGKYIALMGSAHGTISEEERPYPGVPELMQCPFIMVEDNEDFSISFNASLKKENGTIHPHAILYMNPCSCYSS